MVGGYSELEEEQQQEKSEVALWCCKSMFTYLLCTLTITDVSKTGGRDSVQYRSAIQS